MSASPRPLRRSLAGGALLTIAVLALPALTGCGPLGQPDVGAQAGDQKGYVAGDGTVTEIEPAQRGAAVTLAGPSTQGPDVDSATLRGDVVVVNLWYAACGPCRAEAPDLVAAAAEHDGDGVRFLGINARDGAATAQAFEREFSVPYPSVLDAESGSAVLALSKAGAASPQSIPTTLVLDRDGRVAARVLGRAEPSILDALITTVVKEKAP